MLSDLGGERVLVPLAFASAGDELVVLDGGTDIVRNGRTARIAQRFPAEGLQALAVEGLDRRGATLSAAAPEPGTMLRLMAFPPAEQISEGKAPLNIEAALATGGRGPADGAGAPIRFEAPLPNVSGALLDSCGNLAASSVASGVQSMSTTENPRYADTDALLRILGALGITVVYGDCGQSQAASPEAAAEAEPEALPEPEAEDKSKPAAAAAAEPETAQVADDALAKEEAPATPLPAEEIQPGADDGAGATEVAEETPAPAKSRRPAWLGLAALAALLGLSALVYRRRKALAALGTGQAPPGPGHQETEYQGKAAAAQDHLLLRGVLADGTPFEKSLPLRGGQVDLVIGRGGADLDIASAAVSRRHARLSGSVGKLTIGDLGSSNGTSINGVPCLEGETFYLGVGDSVVLGDAQFHIGPEAAKPIAMNRGTNES